MVPGLRRLGALLASWRFPAFVLPLLLLQEALLVAMLFVPLDGGPMGDFARDFRIWCFGYDPASGENQPMYVAMMLSQAPLLGAAIAAVWWKELRALASGGIRRALPQAAAALAVAALAAGSFGLLGAGEGGAAAPGAEPSRLPFPAERLRTAHPMPELRLTDHEGRPLTTADLRGKVALITGVYASCNFTCPMIFAQTKRAVQALPPEARRDLAVVAITLDPARDDAERLAALAGAQGLAAPLYRLATGEPAAVEGLLDRLGFARTRDPETGVIDHANLFLLLDRSGRIAYRFSLGEQQEAWLETALGLLLAEGPGGSRT